jgi:hypothetical protein
VLELSYTDMLHPFVIIFPLVQLVSMSNATNKDQLAHIFKSVIEFDTHHYDHSRSHWPRDLIHEMSWNAGNVGSNPTERIIVYLRLFSTCVVV